MSHQDYAILEKLNRIQSVLKGDDDSNGTAGSGGSEPAPKAQPKGKSEDRATPGARVPGNGAATIAGHELLDAVSKYLGRFVAYPSEHARTAHALWIAHAHLMDAWESTPRIAFLSPEPGSGKTRALEVTETMVPRPVSMVSASAAYLFRRVGSDDGLPTILYDEIDTVFGPKAKDNEDIRGLLNAGHRRGAIAGRCVVRGKTIETEDFPAYCAVALAGLGALPDTILTRAVIIRMRKRAPAEVVESYRHRVHAPEGNALRDMLAQWASSIEGEIGHPWPTMPATIEDRNADVWESLLAVAHAAGGAWPELARVAAVTLVTESKGDRHSLGVRLLSDIRMLFADRDSMATEEIIKGLTSIDEAPWGELQGKPIDARRLARLLQPYGVSSITLRLDGAPNKKGYKRESLFDPWSRYLEKPPAPAPGATAGADAVEII